MKFREWTGKIKQKPDFPILAFLVLFFFFSVSSYNYLSQTPSFSEDSPGEFFKWTSPDETANYVFSKLYAQEGKLSFFEKYNFLVSDIIHPRSFRSDNGEIKPVSFVGLPIWYGSLAKIFGYKALPYFTPAIGALGIVVFYFLVKKVFGRKNALVSSALLAFFPPYVYYSARSMFHNAPFAVFTAAAVCFLFYALDGGEREKRKTIFLWALGGFFFGLAAAFRASEILWLAPAFAVLLAIFWRRLRLLEFFVFAAAVFLALWPSLYWNTALYGGAFFGGYVEMNQSISAIVASGSELARSGFFSLDKIKEIYHSVFRFGLDFHQSKRSFYYYFARMFPFIFWPALAGFILFAKRLKKISRRQVAFFSFFFIASVALVFYYGSWQFFDNPDKTAKTIGNSYTRYWLIVYFAAIPLASHFILEATRRFFRRRFTDVVRAILVAAVALWSVSFALFGSEEGLYFSLNNSKLWRPQFSEVMRLTERNSAIITVYHDKIFFPERKVIAGFFDDDNMIREYARLARRLPVYYYNFNFSPKDFDYLNERKLPPFGLKIEKTASIASDFALYRLADR